MNFTSHTFMGMRVIVDAALDDVPRMHVHPDFAALMPAEFVADLNSWMREFFGTANTVVKVGSNMLAVGPKTYAALLVKVPA